MASEGTNHLVTLFLICNSFCGFGLGVFLFAFGVGDAVLSGAAAVGYVACIVVGLIMTVWSIIGCFGTITQNKKVLSGYIAGMVILSILEIVQLVKLNQGNGYQHNQDQLLRAFFVTTIVMIVFTMVSILLALTIYYRIISGEFAEKERQRRGLGAA